MLERSATAYCRLPSGTQTSMEGGSGCTLPPARLRSDPTVLPRRRRPSARSDLVRGETPKALL
jgi:hypothetical protein